jgi:hydroxymethylbilane synthase
MRHSPSSPRSIRLRIATRGSRLARVQAESVAELLRQQFPELEIALVEIKTRGDREREAKLSSLGGVGFFTKEIQHALLDGRAEIAVHSLKDLPTQGPQSLCLAAVPPRESVADVLFAPRARTLRNLPAGARVGTGSPRRIALVRHARPDLEVVSIRGNVETRLQTAVEGQLEAVVLAEAGLNRLGLCEAITERLDPQTFLPAVGQGALAVECRCDDVSTMGLLAALDDATSRRALEAERALLAMLGGGCSIALGAWARHTTEGLWLLATVLDPQGRERIDAQGGPSEDPCELATQVAQELRRRGAERLLTG